MCRTKFGIVKLVVYVLYSFARFHLFIYLFSICFNQMKYFVSFSCLYSFLCLTRFEWMRFFLDLRLYLHYDDFR